MMRLLLKLSLIVGVAMVACTPISPQKNALNGKCNSNSDCASGLCKENICMEYADCEVEANFGTPFCANIFCTSDANCPSQFICNDEGKCEVGARPDCRVNADCGPGLVCATPDEDDPLQNRCVQCRNSDDCAAVTPGATCNQETNKCVAPIDGKTCTTKADCTDPALPACKISSGECVECISSRDCPAAGAVCRANTCQGGSVDCTLTGSCPSPNQPFCDPSNGQCVSCAMAPAGQECPQGQTCNATTGQCETATGTECTVNADCDDNPDDPDYSLPAGAPTGSTLFCDMSKCADCQTKTQCGAGFNCSTVSMRRICTPNGATLCMTAANCPNANDACVGGECGSTCATSNDCRPGKVCNPASKVCEDAATCSANTDCQTNGQYNGLACVGAPKSCRACSTSAECATSPNDRTTCQNGVCIAPQTGNLPIGAPCTQGGQCASKLCFDFSSYDNTVDSQSLGSFCTSFCTRTNSSTDTADDCPNAPDASLVGAPRNLDATKGFTCLEGGWLDEEHAGINLCVHADDDRQILGWTNESDYPTGTYKKKGGESSLAENPFTGIECQSGYFTQATEGGPAGGICSPMCGNNADCASLGANFVCREILDQVPAGSGIITSIGRRECVPSPAGAKIAGQFCSSASECAEGACDGRCVSTRAPRRLAKSCTSNQQCNQGDTCVANKCQTTTVTVPCDANNMNACSNFPGDRCIDSLCWANTIRSTPSTCETDAQCQNGDRCFDGRCYDPAAVTDRFCENKFSCGNPDLEFCGGRCAQHCNDSTECASNPPFAGANVCRYLPAQPGFDGSEYNDGFFGRAWTRACNTPLAQRSPPPFVDHTIAFGGNCLNDQECVSDICYQGRCADLCGRNGACTQQNAVCLDVDRTVRSDFPSTFLVLPLCVTL